MAQGPNPNLLASLLGTWHGTGQGEYPSIELFDYTEKRLFIIGGVVGV